MEFWVLVAVVLLALPVVGGLLGAIALFQGLSLRRELQRSLVRIADLEVELDALRAEAPRHASATIEKRSALQSEPMDARKVEPVVGHAPTVHSMPIPSPSSPAAVAQPAAAAQPAVAAHPAAAAQPKRATWQLPSADRFVVYLASALGGLTLVLASLLGLKLAMDVGWLGPVPRVVFALLMGTGLFVGSLFLRRHHLQWVASALGGAGLGMLYGALGAASHLYELLPSELAGVLLCGVTAVALLRATRHNDRFLAALGLLGGLLTPLFVSTGENNAPGLFAYLCLLLAGAASAAHRRDWPDVLGLALAGVGVYYVGWTASWYVADQVLWGVLAPVALGLVSVLATQSGRLDLRGGVVLLALLAAPLAAIAWIVPVDPFFVDRVSGLRVARPLGSAPWIAACGPLLLPLPLWWLERRLPRLAGVASAMTGLLSVIFVVSWASHPTAPRTALLFGVLSPCLVALAASYRQHHGAALAVLPAALGLGIALNAAPSPQATIYAPLLLLLFGLLLTARTRSPVALPAVLVSATLIGLASLPLIEQQGGATVVVPSLAAYGVLVMVPLFSGRGSRVPSLDWAVAALAGPLLFLPLYGSWQQVLGASLIGMLPVILGIVSLLAARLLLYRERVDRQSSPIALFLTTALAGATLALPLQLDSQWLSVGWALEVAALAALSRRMHHALIRWTALGLALVVGVRLLVNPWTLAYGDAAGLPILNWTLYTWGVPAVAMFTAARLLAPTRRSGRLGTVEELHPLLYVMLGIGLGFALVNAQVSHAFQDAGPLELGGSGLMQDMVRSMSWAGFGVMVLVAGLGAGSRIIRFTGFGFVLLAAAKVFLVDLWDLDGLLRVGSVLALGLSLLLAAFLFERLVLRPPSTSPDANSDPEGVL